MSRPTQWYRDYAYTDGLTVGVPWVQELAQFQPGETLMRTRLELQVTGTTDDTQQNYPNCWEGVAMVAALLWQEAEGDYPPDPPGYYDTALYPWIWVQQLSWWTMDIIPRIDPSPGYADFANTTPSQIIDCHSARATSPGNYSKLWLVIDSVATNPLWAVDFLVRSLNTQWSVMSKLPAS